MKTIRILTALLAFSLCGCFKFTKVGVAANYGPPNRLDVDHLAGTPLLSAGTVIIVGGAEYTVTSARVFSPQNAPVTDRYYQIAVEPDLTGDPTSKSVVVREFKPPIWFINPGKGPPFWIVSP